MSRRRDIDLRIGYAGAAVVLVGVWALSHGAGNYFLKFATFLMMYQALSISWNFIGGFCGYPSFATAAFFGLGAYTGGVAQAAALPAVLSWALAMAGAALFASLLGAVLLRLRGHYFAVGSIAVVEVLRELAVNWDAVTSGAAGLNVPLMPGSPEAVGRYFLYCMTLLAVLAFVVSLHLHRSRLGFGLRLIAQNESAATACGVATTRYKIAALALSAAFAAGAGGIYASLVGYLEPSDAFSVLMSIKVVAMAMLGGVGTLLGPVVGSAVFFVVEEMVWVRFLHLHSGILGLIIVAVVFIFPRGLLRLTLRRETVAAST